MHVCAQAIIAQLATRKNLLSKGAKTAWFFFQFFPRLALCKEHLHVFMCIRKTFSTTTSSIVGAYKTFGPQATELYLPYMLLYKKVGAKLVRTALSSDITLLRRVTSWLAAPLILLLCPSTHAELARGQKVVGLSLCDHEGKSMSKHQARAWRKIVKREKKAAWWSPERTPTFLSLSLCGGSLFIPPRLLPPLSDDSLLIHTYTHVEEEKNVTPTSTSAFSTFQTTQEKCHKRSLQCYEHILKLID